MSLTEAMKNPEISSKINNVYEALIREVSFQYLEIGNQFVEFMITIWEKMNLYMERKRP